jgi:hypothetical protein
LTTGTHDGDQPAREPPISGSGPQDVLVKTLRNGDERVRNW